MNLMLVCATLLLSLLLSWVMTGVLVLWGPRLRRQGYDFWAKPCGLIALGSYLLLLLGSIGNIEPVWVGWIFRGSAVAIPIVLYLFRHRLPIS
jgi:hypothetical protein